MRVLSLLIHFFASFSVCVGLGTANSAGANIDVSGDPSFDYSAGAALASNASAWYSAYTSTCLAHAPWRDALSAYSALHARALAVLRNSSESAVEPRPSLSVYRIPRRRSIIGLGCLLPGLSNVFLSALKRGRVFLLDWPGSEPVFAVPEWLPGVRSPWKPLAKALGADRTSAHYKGFAAGYNTAATVSGVRAPALWGAIPADDPVDVETHWIFNRGAYTHMGAQTEEEFRWLATVLPRDASGSTLWGCVYAAVVPLTPALLARSDAVPLPAPPLPPAQQRRDAPPALVCLHVRTWALEPVPTDAPPAESKYVRAAFECLEKVLVESNASRATTTVYVASDDVEVRSLARVRFGADFTVATATDEPAQIAFINEEDDDARAEEITLGSWAEWARLVRCPVLVGTAYSGYARSAGAAGARSALYFYDEDALGPNTGSGGRACVRRQDGAERELTKGFGAGW